MNDYFHFVCVEFLCLSMNDSLMVLSSEGLAIESYLNSTMNLSKYVCHSLIEDVVNLKMMSLNFVSKIVGQT